MCECSICLSPVRHTRASKQLECGHLYHGSCINEWITAGGDTCPMCRSTMAHTVQKFKVTVRVENTHTNQVSEDEIVTALLEMFQGEINFGADTSEELQEIIASLGLLRRVDVNALVLNTE